jgi:hypothetical protein
MPFIKGDVHSPIFLFPYLDLWRNWLTRHAHNVMIRGSIPFGSTMKCKKCDIEFEPRKGYKTYCSDKCRNSRNFSETAIQKKSIATSKMWNYGNLKDLNWKEINNDKNKIEKCKEHWIQLLKKRIDNGDKIWIGTLKKFLIEENGHKCMICETEEWMGNFIHLEIDHIDGDKKNNNLTNLRILCPNCHSQTDTWRFKNNFKKKRNT